jgi:hypothetical protein
MLPGFLDWSCSTGGEVILACPAPGIQEARLAKCADPILSVCSIQSAQAAELVRKADNFFDAQAASVDCGLDAPYRENRICLQGSRLSVVFRVDRTPDRDQAAGSQSA